MSVYDCQDPEQRRAGLDEAVDVLGRGGLAVIPTDTVYGIASDAFDPAAVAALLAAKGRGRQMPPPVLVGAATALDGLATEVPKVVRDLVARFWPGPLTIVCLAQPSLAWDLGETDGSVALRMPDDETALELLRRTGPLAVSSANRSGQPAATTAAEAVGYFDDTVPVYLDAGESGGAVASTIVDATAERLVVLRRGALAVEELAEIAPELLPDVPEQDEQTARDEQAAQSKRTDTEQPRDEGSGPA
ncbi:hypothetical protein GCM10023169_11820 [Georgenia halophila]|uniref:L-threonylcarbamoyladenylate synthase n=1 Tax=Georgenia halophila TaxID=620889 RepID=A0ABP8KVW4_9MICO